MKAILLARLLAALTLVVSPVALSGKVNSGAGNNDGPRFDRDGNGKLSESERAARKAAAEREREFKQAAQKEKKAEAAKAGKKGKAPTAKEAEEDAAKAAEQKKIEEAKIAAAAEKDSVVKTDESAKPATP
jgi:hypothetical protein